MQKLVFRGEREKIKIEWWAFNYDEPPVERLVTCGIWRVQELKTQSVGDTEKMFVEFRKIE